MLQQLFFFKATQKSCGFGAKIGFRSIEAFGMAPLPVSHAGRSLCVFTKPPPKKRNGPSSIAQQQSALHVRPVRYIAQATQSERPGYIAC